MLLTAKLVAEIVDPILRGICNEVAPVDVRAFACQFQGIHSLHRLPRHGNTSIFSNTVRTHI
jgi:hypothetical protein